MLPVAVYGLEVPAGDVIVPAVPDFPATFRLTMAALDPSAPPQIDDAHAVGPPRATLKIIREPIEPDEDDYDEDEDDYDSDDIDAIRARLKDAMSSDEDDEDEDDSETEGKNGGPSDPSKTEKIRKDAAAAQLMKALEEDAEMEDAATNGVNGTKSDKGKGKAKAITDMDMDEYDSDDDDGEDLEMEEFVVCTLDPERNYQQPLDITVGEDERVYFKVTGTHNIFLTGNYIVFPDEPGMVDSDEEEDDYDYTPDEDEIEDMAEDELDDLEDPRITEVHSDEAEDAPALVKTADKKGKNKRAAESEDEAGTLDDIISKSLKPADVSANGEQKLSKKQLKKLKNNAGQPVTAAVENQASKKEDTGVKKSDASKKESPATKGDKKVQFAKDLEQGPSGSPKTGGKGQDKTGGKPSDPTKPTLGVKMVQGVKVDDKKLGEGPVAKKGDRVHMRYIGKLEKGDKVFDSNRKGKPFAFKLGSGEVIKGWDIGVAGMSVRGERRITIPAHLGYGSQNMPGIPPNSNLIFEVKMLSIEPK